MYLTNILVKGWPVYWLKQPIRHLLQLLKQSSGNMSQNLVCKCKCSVYFSTQMEYPHWLETSIHHILPVPDQILWYHISFIRWHDALVVSVTNEKEFWDVAIIAGVSRTCTTCPVLLRRTSSVRPTLGVPNRNYFGRKTTPLKRHCRERELIKVTHIAMDTA